MKAIFSNWIEPQNENWNTGYRTMEEFLIGLEISVKLASQHYECHFAGDPFSCGIVTSKNLPFYSIQTLDFSKAPKGLWNYSKLLACSVFEPPFIHIDNDVFVSKILPDFDDYLFQNTEHLDGYPFYDKPIGLMKHLDLPENIFNLNNRVASNCGIIGIKRKELVDEWINPVIDFVHTHDFKNLKLQRPDILFEIVIEQFTANCSINYHKRKSKYLLKNELESDAIKTGYCHMVSSTKRNDFNFNRIKKFYEQNIKKQ